MIKTIVATVEFELDVDEGISDSELSDYLTGFPVSIDFRGTEVAELMLQDPIVWSELDDVLEVEFLG